MTPTFTWLIRTERNTSESSDRFVSRPAPYLRNSTANPRFPFTNVLHCEHKRLAIGVVTSPRAWAHSVSSAHAMTDVSPASRSESYSGHGRPAPPASASREDATANGKASQGTPHLEQRFTVKPDTRGQRTEPYDSEVACVMLSESRGLCCVLCTGQASDWDIYIRQPRW